MRALLEAISRRLHLDSGHHAAAVLAVAWLLTVVVAWLAGGGR